MFDQLIDLHKQKKQLEYELAQKKAEFEKTIAHEKAQLERFEIEENKLREEALLRLEKADTASVVVGDFSISKRSKITRRVENLNTLWEFSLKDGRDIITTELGYKKDFDKDLFDMQVVEKDKKAVKQLIEDYYNLTGNLPAGVESKETKYITISEII